MEKPHKKLHAWNLSMDLVIDVYRITNSFPVNEMYSLTGQMRRAAISVPSNIAEGAARQTKKEFVNYLHMAQGSLSELDTQTEIALRLGYIEHHDAKQLETNLERVDKIPSGLIRHQKR